MASQTSTTTAASTPQLLHSDAMIPLASGFCYVNNRGDVCPIANIDLFSLTSKDMETAERYLDEAATKLKSILVCKQVTENVRSGIKALQTLGPGKLGKVKKATIRLVSTHGLEHFVASVPLRYKPDVDDQEDLEKQLAAVFRVWPFNVCINISTWISPTNLRRLTASGNLVPFGRWCLSYPIMLQNIDIPEDAKDKGFSMFGETSIWTAFYAEWRAHKNLTDQSDASVREWSTPGSGSDVQIQGQRPIEEPVTGRRVKVDSSEGRMFQNRQTALPYISPEPSEMSIESAEQTTWAFPPRNFIVAPNQSSEPTTSIGASTPASTPSTEPQQSDMNGVECHTNCNYHPSTGMQCSPDPRVHASHQLAPTPQWNYQSGPVESLQMFYHTSSIPFTEESPSSGLSYPQNQPAPQWPLGQTFDYPIMDENGYRHPYPIPQGHENMQNPMQQ